MIRLKKNRKAFTLPEALTAIVISLFTMLLVWSIYEIGFRWWSDIEPRIDGDSACRVALSSIIDGFTGDAGADVIVENGVQHTYKRRNGISCATAVDPNANNTQWINFALEKDNAGAGVYPRGYQLGVVNGLNVVQYIDANGAVHNLAGTSGITDLRFSQAGKIVTVEVKFVKASTLSSLAAPITVDYKRSVFLRN